MTQSLDAQFNNPDSFRQLAETTSAAILIYESQVATGDGMKIVYANPAATRITGYSRQELLGMSFWSLAHPTYQNIVRQSGGANQWVAGIPTRYELKLLTKAGEERWVDVSAGDFTLDGLRVILVTAFDITDRDRAERELRAKVQQLRAAESELLKQNAGLAQASHLAEVTRRRYQELFEFAPDGYLVTDVTGKIQEANRAAGDLLKMPQDRLVGEPLLDFWSPDQRKEWGELLARMDKGEETPRLELVLRPCTGVAFPASVAVAPIRDADGELVGLRWMVRNIWERKRAEQALRRAHDMLEARVEARTAELARAIEGLRAEIAQRTSAEQALRLERNFVSTVLDTAGALVVVLDSQGRMIRFNRACERATGWLFDEIRARPLWKLAPPEEEGLVRAMLDKLWASQVHSQCEYHWLARDGRRILVQWDNTILLSPEGTVDYIVSTGLDVTESRRAEYEREQLLAQIEAAAQEALRANRLLHALIENMPVGVMVSDAGGDILLSNPAANAILGGVVTGNAYGPKGAYTVHQVSGDPIPPEEMPLARAIDRGETIHGLELIVRREDGRQVPVLVGAGPVHEIDGSVVSGVAVMQDITERKQADQERERLLAELERRASELDAVINSMVEAVIIYDAEGNPRRANPAAVAACGFDPVGMDRVTLLRRLDMRFPDGSPFIPDQFPSSRALHGETVLDARLLLGATGTLAPIIATASPLYSNDILIGVVTVWHNAGG